MPDDDVYVPLHVGAEGKESLGYLPDNTGDHISSKNPSYCELTGLYWAWKIWTVNISVSAITEDTLARVFIQEIQTRKKKLYSIGKTMKTCFRNMMCCCRKEKLLYRNRAQPVRACPLQAGSGRGGAGGKRNVSPVRGSIFQSHE